MLKNLIFLLSSLCLVALSGCDKEPVFPIEPQIEFLDIQPKRVKSLGLDEPIQITFRFQDGDGNLGALDSTDINLEIIDSRINSSLTPEKAISKYSIPNLTPDARKPSIQGEITVTIPFTIVVNPTAQEEEIRFQIKMWDREGNLATPITSNPDNSIYTDFITVYR